ncbi:MAG: hypothetical protein JGK03_07845 [Microcoleus sp. PH2017_25_DOB_D_A]|uniref:hypothetical protein n=1 Tax=unclassified Microcoleus TaxID=2642155 RepID=UPI001DB6FDED|nr:MULTISPECIES: hypothetical protein [unclassified Microcoleus]MCC3442519.1 hypothetical protein [Microcoleus sp. PH2017_03_ELD_O_A]TAE44312.1 MAG: hypothetical protein EAZ90_07985 [Oscillatoriales cyanobacterium]MCC3438457.1 hypothetical protein [Microcoleus sp. PH2017_05_CCC_O_A]MCC3445849.1 hypothetical protein [Microcoleus sp. PH2017_09_SFU_O_A]MCC3534110.1 hypothetical protein [Microcoleus sp. PH2017_25_DOB_D_A]
MGRLIYHDYRNLRLGSPPPPRVRSWTIGPACVRRSPSQESSIRAIEPSAYFAQFISPSLKEVKVNTNKPTACARTDPRL